MGLTYAQWLNLIIQTELVSGVSSVSQLLSMPSSFYIFQ